MKTHLISDNEIVLSTRGKLETLLKQREDLVVALERLLSVGDSVSFQQKAKENARAILLQVKGE